MQISISNVIGRAISLGSYVSKLIKAFKARVAADIGIFEAEPCLSTTLKSLNTIGLLDKTSLCITPNAYKESILYSVVPNTTLGDMTIVRATTATRVNNEGLIEVVPRNLLTYSNDFTNAVWVKNSCTISTNSIISPDGTQNASKLVEGTANDSHHIYQNATANGQNTFTFYAKQGERKFVYAYADSVGQGKCFDLENGIIGANIIAPPTNSTITTVGNGWYRCSITLSITTSTALRIGACSTNGTFSYLGNGTSGIYIYGAQLEQGSTATEYFPTTTRLNIPRIDYTNGSCPSLLVEPQRTNVQTYSQDFSNAIYLQIGATVNTNALIAPDGTITADKIIEDTSTGFHTIDILNPPVVAGSYTVSVFVKAAERTKFQILGFFALTGNVDFDLTAGTATTTAPALNGKIENYGNGWYRCSATFTDLTGSGAQILFNILNNAGSNNYAGTAGSGLYIWGAQLELGTYSTSYIPTVAGTVTRNADVISKTGISSLIGQTEGTIFFDGIVNGCQNSSANLLNGEKNVNNSFNISYIKSSKNIVSYVYASGVTKSLISGAIIEIGQRFKAAYSYKSGDSILYINGIQIGTSTDIFTFPNPLNEINIGDSITYFNFQESILNNSVQLYKTRLSNSELQSLTTL